MKTLVAALIATATLVFSSCVVRPPSMVGGQTQGGGRQLTAIKVTKTKTGLVQVRVRPGNESKIPQVEGYSKRFYEKNGRVPTEGELSAHFGFPAQAHWVDTPDKKVGSVTVRPDEVPEHIRARF